MRRPQVLFLVLLFLTIGLVVVIIAKQRRRVRESYVINSPSAVSLLHRLSEAMRDILSSTSSGGGGGDYLTAMLNGRDVYNEFTMEEGSRSYTENKKRIVVCLRKNPNEFYSWNSLMYVLCHEVAHVICDELHHTEKFNAINAALLKRAETLGYYDPRVPFESKYCGL
jgi:hypothetical protein